MELLLHNPSQLSVVAKMSQMNKTAKLDKSSATTEGDVANKLLERDT